MSELLRFILDHNDQFRTARLPSLYSDFRLQKTINPDGYTANITAWRTALEDATQHGLLPGNHLLVLQSGEELLRQLETRQWSRPLALGVVFSEAIANKDLVTLKDFLTATKSVKSSSWVITPWDLMQWGLRQLRITTSEINAYKAENFVVLKNVENAAIRVIQRARNLTNPTERIFTKEMFTEEFKNTIDESKLLSSMDVEVLITYLRRDKREISYDGHIIKFKAPEKQTEPITTEDITIASLKTLIKSLNAQVSVLASQVEQLSATARKAVESKNKPSALATLTRRKIAVTALTGRSNTLAQLEEVYVSITQAADQVEVIRVMEASANILRGLNKQVGGVERVHNLMDDLREETGTVEEVAGVISEGVTGGVVVDEAEVDEELKALEREEQEKIERMEAEAVRKKLDQAGEKTNTPQHDVEATLKGLEKMSLDEPARWAESEQRHDRIAEANLPGS